MSSSAAGWCSYPRRSRARLRMSSRNSGCGELVVEVGVQLAVAVDVCAHVVGEAVDDELVVERELGQCEPEVVEVASLAAGVEGAELGGEDLLDLEGPHVGACAPPAGVDAVGQQDVGSVWGCLLDVDLDLDRDRRRRLPVSLCETRCRPCRSRGWETCAFAPAVRCPRRYVAARSGSLRSWAHRRCGCSRGPRSSARGCGRCSLCRQVPPRNASSLASSSVGCDLD